MIRKLEPSEYEDYICAEIGRVLLRLRESYGLRVDEAELDIKAVSVEIRLDGHLPRGAVTLLKEEFDNLPGLRLGDGWIACVEHYCSVEIAEHN